MAIATPKFKLANRRVATPPVTSIDRALPVHLDADPIAAAMQQASADMPRLLSPAAVAEMLGVAERTLERWRITGDGPRFVKLSRKAVRYCAKDVAAFIAERIRANTAQ